MKLRNLVAIGMGLFVCGIFCIAFPREALCAESTSLGIGFVDLDQLLEKYTEYQQVNKDFDKYQQMGRRKILARRFLTWDEWKQLDQYEERDAKGEKFKDEEKKEWGQLLKLSEDREAKLRELQGVRDATDQQKKDRQDLESLEKGNSSKIQELGKELAREGNEKFSKLLNDLRRKVTDAISETAEAKGLKVVVDKKYLFWANKSLDITEDVVKKLNTSRP